jgi:hypothetical protein
MSGIPVGLCQCGCGQQTKPAPSDYWQRGWVKGVPLKYVTGHGGKTGKGKYYREVRRPGGRTYEHIVIAERALGKALPEGAHVHHVNGNPRDNRPANLVVCQDAGYHKLIHQRQRAYDACGHADWRKCKVCKQYDAPGNMEIEGAGRSCYHFECKQRRGRELRDAALARAGKGPAKPRNRRRYCDIPGHPKGGKCKAQGQFTMEKKVA